MTTNQGDHMETGPMTENKAPTLLGECDAILGMIKNLEKNCRDIKSKLERDFRGQEQAYPGQHGDVLGQITLAFRHLKDTRMRIGKVIQYSGDGVSVYDK